MKRTAMCIATAIVAAMVAVMLAGCSSQSSTSASASAASSASASAEQSQAEIIAELNEALANVPAYKSVTVTEEDETTLFADEITADDSSASSASIEAASSESAASSAAAEEAGAEADVLKSKTVYQFDASGDKLKTSMTGEIGDIKIQFFSDGDDAVCVTDGPVYSGTTEQFELSHFAGIDTYLMETIGDPNVLIDCAANAEKLESHGLTYYMLTLDPEKYIASDEILTMMADSGESVREAFFTIGFEEDGSIASMDLAITYETFKNWKGLMFSDYDSTVIDSMPEADKTYEEMEADSQAKIDALYDELEMTDDIEGETDSSGTAELK